jgi:hypothetical protein
LFSQPRIAVHVGKALLPELVAWTVNLDDDPMFEADKIEEKVAERDLSLKLGAFASAVANSPPNEGLRLNGLRALFARETAEYGLRDVSRHDGTLASLM